MIISEFESVIREYVDYSDPKTLKAIAEASNSPKDQTQILSALTSKLYDLITQKADKIDYSTIAKSKGDITKVQNYDQLVECVNLIRQIVVEYKQNTKIIDTVSTAIENIKSRTTAFKKAFAVGAPIPIMLYNNIVLNIVNSVSFMIATCIEYVKSPTANSFDIALDTVAYNRTMQNLMYKNLEQFNKGCQSPEFDSTLNVCLSKRIVKEAAAEESDPEEEEKDKPFFTPEDIEKGKEVVIHDVKEKTLTEDYVEDGFHLFKALLFVLKCFIPLIRTAVYYFFHVKQSISDYFIVQAQMLEMNADRLQYNNAMDDNSRRKVYERQMKIASTFRNISNKFAIKDSTATKKSSDMKKSEDKEYTADELANEIVDNGDDIF